MPHIPSGLVADLKVSLELTCGDRTFGVDDQRRREKPFHQRKMRVVKQCAGRDRELVAACDTLVQTPARNDRGSLSNGRFGQEFEDAG